MNRLLSKYERIFFKFWFLILTGNKLRGISIKYSLLAIVLFHSAMLPEEQSIQVAIRCCKPTDLEKAFSKRCQHLHSNFSKAASQDPCRLRHQHPTLRVPWGSRGGEECSVIVQRARISGTNKTDRRLKSCSQEGEERQRPAQSQATAQGVRATNWSLQSSTPNALLGSPASPRAI